MLGGGSNVVLTQDFDGLVLHIAMLGRRIIGDGPDAVQVELGAGENWHDAVCWTLDLGLSGLECLALIPGSVGAAPVQNIGAYGVELVQLNPRVHAIDTQTLQRVVIDPHQAEYAYRDSLFKQRLGRYLILAVELTLSRCSLACPVTQI